MTTHAVMIKPPAPLSRSTDTLPERPQTITAMTSYTVNRWQAGAAQQLADWVAEEVPVALEYNGLAHAVMLCSPQDLDDFARGFSLSECIVETAAEVYDIQIQEQPEGIQIAIRIPQSRFWALKSQRRSLAGRTGCGLCGKESLAQLVNNLDPVLGGPAIAASALERALNRLNAQQPLFKQTGSVHAAAWCDAQGNILAVREDVGRHNALDKLLGHAVNSNLDLTNGVLLMSSRASYEIVQKAAACGISMIAAISGPTGLAVRLAQELGVTLIGFARDDRLSVYTHAERIF